MVISLISLSYIYFIYLSHGHTEPRTKTGCVIKQGTTPSFKLIVAPTFGLDSLVVQTVFIRNCQQLNLHFICNYIVTV